MELIDIVNENNEFTGQIEEREIAYEKGLWRRTVSCWIMNEKGEILLQKRSSNKKKNPNKWAKTGGQVDSGESVENAIFREVKEELGISINDDDIKYLVGSTSINEQGDIINKHYNECYLVTKNIDISDIKIQKEEVSEVRYFSKDELLKRISNNYEDLTEKTGPWNFLKKILEDMCN